MLKHAIKRILIMIPILLIVSLIVFFIMSAAPGDPVQLILGENATEEACNQTRMEMGLNDPTIVQYGRYIKNIILKGDFGISYKTKKPVSDEIWSRFPNTLLLAGAALIFSLILSIPLGVFAAVKQNTWIDTGSMFFCLIGISMPAFWLALLLLIVFSVNLGWLPSQGMGDWKNLILPAFSLGFTHLAAIARTTRSSMLETIRQDYVTTARSKGISKRVVTRTHALKNAMIPMTTIIGMQICGLLGGAMLTEIVFAWPGIGRFVIQSIQGRDTPSVLGCIILLSVVFGLINLTVDLLYGFIDPRVRTQY